MPDTLSLPALPALLGARGLCLRPRQPGDQLALDALYQAWRVEQFAPGGLPLADCQQLPASNVGPSASITGCWMAHWPGVC